MRDSIDVQKLRPPLLRWYVRHRRVMPWRAEPGELADAYHVLVSETMLQQTQVATVVDYFHRFIDAFPTAQSLAAADEQEVLRLWQGLGYYRRARMLHRTAQRIVQDHAGRIPDTVETLLHLPGIGRYTAGAVASIAWGRSAPVVDGNVARVLSRLCGERRGVDEPAVIRRLWEVMKELVTLSPRSRRFHAGDINQAMMELGATVCTPRQPRCARCPVQSLCRAAASGSPQRFGAKARRTPPRTVTFHVMGVKRNDHWLMERRPDTGLWAGLWQMPTHEIANGHATGSSVSKAMRHWVSDRFGLNIGAISPAGQFIHRTTHRRIRFHVHATTVEGGRLKRGSGRWRRLPALEDLPMSNAQKHVVQILQAAQR